MQALKWEQFNALLRAIEHGDGQTNLPATRKVTEMGAVLTNCSGPKTRAV